MNSVLLDTDVIIWEGDPTDPTRKPPEMYTLIENFCLGMRRLEIFGKLTSLRRGWITVFAPGQEDHLSRAADGNGNIPVDAVGEDGFETRIIARRWTQETWEEDIKNLAGGNKLVVPMTQEIDTLRPKSPVRSGQSGPTIGTTQTPSGTIGVGGVAAMSVPVGMMNSPVPRFSPGNKMSGNNQVLSAQNQLMIQPMMSMNIPPMGMGMEDMMGNWNPMMGNMAAMSMNLGAQVGGTRGLPNAAGLGMGMGMGAPGMTMQMMNQLGMGNIQGGGFMSGINPIFSNEGWGEQSHFGGMESGWDTGQAMNAQINIGNGMNPGLNMGNMGIGMGQSWGNF